MRIHVSRKRLSRRNLRDPQLTRSLSSGFPVSRPDTPSCKIAVRVFHLRSITAPQASTENASRLCDRSDPPLSRTERIPCPTGTNRSPGCVQRLNARLPRNDLQLQPKRAPFIFQPDNFMASDTRRGVQCFTRRRP